MLQIKSKKIKNWQQVVLGIGLFMIGVFLHSPIGGLICFIALYPILRGIVYGVIGMFKGKK